jgi:PAS domain S-box-containing protein
MSILNGHSLLHAAFNPTANKTDRSDPPQTHGASRDVLRARWVRSALRMLPLDDVIERGQALRQIAGSSDDVWWLYEPHGNRFLYVSPAYERRWKRSAAALYAAAPRWLEDVHCDDREPVRQAFDRLRSGDGYAIEYRTTTGSGKERWIAERAFAVAGTSGAKLRMAGVSVDVTARKLVELERLRTDRCTDAFLVTLGHELRGPLQPIRFAALALSGQHADAAEQTRKTVAIIDRQVSYLTRLVDDLLDTARIRHGRMRLQNEAVRLAEVLEAAIDGNRELVERKHLRVEVLLPEADVTMTGDTLRLTQVFGNLVHNAAKFSEIDGEIRLTLRADPDGRRVTVSVRDSGIGMAPERIESLFDFLAQEEAPASRDHGGLGVGLSVVRGLVELHGGTVTACSGGPGCGSEFVVTLPTCGTIAAMAAP